MLSKQKKLVVVSIVLLVLMSLFIGLSLNTQKLTTSEVEVSESKTVTDFNQLSEENQAEFRDHIMEGEITTGENMVSIAESSYIMYEGTVYKTGIESGYSINFFFSLLAFCAFMYGFGAFTKASELSNFEYEFISMRAFVSFMSVILFSRYIV